MVPWGEAGFHDSEWRRRIRESVRPDIVEDGVQASTLGFLVPFADRIAQTELRAGVADWRNRGCC